MARQSQYLESYLERNRTAGIGNGLTINTYLSYVLRGRAKDWIGKYGNALANSLECVGAVSARSKGGSIAFYPADMFTLCSYCPNQAVDPDGDDIPTCAEHRPGLGFKFVQ